MSDLPVQTEGRRCQIQRTLVKEDGLTKTCKNEREEPLCVQRGPEGSWTHLPHNLPPIEEHFVSLPESIPGAIRCRRFWG